MTIGIDDGTFYLIDNWPGVPTNGPNPDAWTGQSTTDTYGVGAKRQVYQATNKGFATFMWLYYTTGAGTVAAAVAKSPCGIDTTAMATAAQYFHVTNDGSDAQLVGPIAVALSTMVTARYAWFWVGGVCPVDSVSALGGVHLSDGSITAGVHMVLADSASICKYHLGAATDFCTFSAFAMVADTTA